MDLALFVRGPRPYSPYSMMLASLAVILNFAGRAVKARMDAKQGL